MADQQGISKDTLKEILRLGQLIGEPKHVAGIDFVVIPADCKIESLERFQHSQYAENPHRKIGMVSVFDGGSFAEYCNLFSDENSRVFADETKNTVLAVLDYHAAHADGAPRWGQHRVNLKLVESKEWLIWHSKNGAKFTQTEFAEFIEDNTPDIIEPKPATMLEMARDLQAKTDVDYSSALRLNNGQVQFTYNEQVKGTYGAGKVEIPEEFVVSIPVYVGAARVSVRARLRYRLLSGKLLIWYNLLRPEVIERAAFASELDQIKAALKVSIINGTPG